MGILEGLTINSARTNTVVYCRDASSWSLEGSRVSKDRHDEISQLSQTSNKSWRSNDIHTELTEIFIFIR